MDPTPPPADSAAAAPFWSLRLLDHFSLRGPDGDAGLTARKAIALLVFLALQRDRLARRDTVANLLWSAVDTAQGRVSLRQAIAAIRRVEGDHPILVTQPDTIALAAEVAVDVDRFARLAAGGVDERIAAADLYRTDLVAGFALRDEPAFNEWLTIAQAHWRQRAVDVLLSLGEAGLAPGGDGHAAITALLKLLAIDPFNEAAHRMLMRIYARQGRAALAMTQYRSLADLLRRELQVSPEADTQAVYEEIRGNRRQPGSEAPHPATARPSATPPVSPEEAAAATGAAGPLSRSGAHAHRPRWPWLAMGAVAVLVAGGGFALWLAGSTGRDRAPAITRVYPVAAGESDERQPAVSPDGTLVVYRMRRGNAAQLYLSAIDGGGEPSQITAGSAAAARPAWRRDGRAIAFVREAAERGGRCAIFVRPMPIGQEQQVGRCMTSASTNLSWSADGGTLYFDDEASIRLNHRIFALRIADGTVRPVTDEPSGTNGDTQALVSHDGKRLAFVRFRDTASDLIVHDLASGTMTVVQHDVVGLWGTAWSAKDRGLFYTVLDGSQAGLWWTPLRGASTPTRLSSGLTSYNSMSASASGTRLVVQVAQRRSDFLRLDQGAAVPRRTTLRGFAANDFDRLLTEAPDGSIAFVSTRSGQEQLMLARAGQAPRIIDTGGAGAFSWLALSPDSRHLAAAATQDGRSRILLIDLATRQVRTLHRSGALDNYPAWSADGRHLYWSTLRDHASALVRVPLADPAALQAVAAEEFGIVRFAGDGRSVYYTLLGRSGIWRRDVAPDGRLRGPPSRVVDDLSAGSFRAWTLAGDAIFYKRTNGAGLAEVRRKSLADGRATTVLTADDDQSTFQPFASSNGSVLIERARYQNDLSGIDVE